MSDIFQHIAIVEKQVDSSTKLLEYLRKVEKLVEVIEVAKDASKEAFDQEGGKPGFWIPKEEWKDLLDKYQSVY